MDVTSFFFSVDKQPPVLFQTWQMIMYNVHSIISINRFIFFHKCTAQKVEGSLISLLNKCFKGNQLFLKVSETEKTFVIDIRKYQFRFHLFLIVAVIQFRMIVLDVVVD